MLLLSDDGCEHFTTADVAEALVMSKAERRVNADHIRRGRSKSAPAAAEPS
jgi:hypothetical protein